MVGSRMAVTPFPIKTGCCVPRPAPACTKAAVLGMLFSIHWISPFSMPALKNLKLRAGQPGMWF